MKQWFVEWLEDVISKRSYLTERMLEIIIDNVGSDRIAYMEDTDEQYEYLENLLKGDK